MKKLFCVLVLLWVLAPACFAQENIPQAWQEIAESTPITSEEFSAMTLPDYLEKAITLAKDSLLAPLRLLAKLCGVLILAALAKSLASESASGSVHELLDTIVTLAVFGLCSPSLLGLMGVIQSAVEQSRTYLASFIPIFASVMASCGQVSSSLVCNGFFFGMAMFVSDALCRIALPCTRIFIALHAAAAVGSTMDLHHLTDIVARWVKWLLTFCATVFAALLGLQSALAQNADTLALKTGKFLVGSSVPVVGRAISDAMGSVLAGIRLLKGSMGFAAVAVLAAIFIPILLQCVAYHLVFSLASMMAGAAGNGKACKLFDGFVQCVSLYISITFFFSLLVIAGTMLMILVGGGA